MKAASIAVLAVVLGWSEPNARAAGEGTGELEDLLEQPLVSSASKVLEASSLAPATSSVVTAEDLRRYGIRSLDEALNYLSMGMLTESTLGAVEVGSRGVLLSGDYGNHVLLLIDGHALNEPWNGTAYYERGAAIPLELVDHIEVILGPGSVLYGSNAMLGVINVITKEASQHSGLHLSLEGGYPLSGRVAAGAGAEFTWLGTRGSVTAQLEYFRAQGPELSFGPQPWGVDSVTGEPKRFDPTGAGTGIWGGTAGRALMTQVPAAYARLRLGAFELSVRAAEYQRWTPYLYGNFDDPNGFERDRWLSLDASWSGYLEQRVQLRLRAYGDLYGYEFHQPTAAAEDCYDGQLQGCAYDLGATSRWGGAEASASVDWFNDGRMLTLLGVDGRVRYIASKDGYADAADPTSIAGPHRYSHLDGTLGAYLTQLARPLRWLALDGGARFDYDPSFGWHLSPRAAVTFSLWQGAYLKGLYSEAFRAPSAYELYYADYKTEIPALGLHPEIVRSVEGAFEQRLGGQRLLVGVFAAWWSDLIALKTLTEEEVAAAQARGELGETSGEAVQYRNVSKVRSFGGNLAFDGTLLDRRLRYGLSATLAWAREISPEGESSLPAAAWAFGNARISWDQGAPYPAVALAARVVSPRAVAGKLLESDSRLSSTGGPAPDPLRARPARPGAVVSAGRGLLGLRSRPVRRRPVARARPRLRLSGAGPRAPVLRQPRAAVRAVSERSLPAVRAVPLLPAPHTQRLEVRAGLGAPDPAGRAVELALVAEDDDRRAAVALALDLAQGGGRRQVGLRLVREVHGSRPGVAVREVLTPSHSG
ncbi:MAG: TonB-dependent receptor [Myxococcales bacterium]